VVDPDHGDLGDLGQFGDGVLGGLRVDVLAAGDDHVVLPAHHVQPAGGVETPQVTGVHQAVEDFAAGAVGVALEQHLVLGEDATGDPAPDRVAVLVQHAHDRAQRSPARGVGGGEQVRRGGDARPG